MAFLQKTELNSVGQINLINKLLNSNDEILDTIIAESIALMKSYLSRKYDIDIIFNATGEDRHAIVVKRLKDIVIYEVYERLSRESNSVAARRFSEAMVWLEKLNTGELYDNTLPAIPATEVLDGTLEEGDTRFGGNIKYTGGY